MTGNASLWIAGTGMVSVLVMLGLYHLGRSQSNQQLLSSGQLAEAEIMSCQHEGSRFSVTVVSFRFTPVGYHTPIEVTRRLEGRVDLHPGQRVEVRYLASHPQVCLLVAYAARHDPI
jgi:hypothetical protein